MSRPCGSDGCRVVIACGISGRRSMIVHFGQVMPLKDVEEVLDFVTSITRYPCGCRLQTTR